MITWRLLIIFSGLLFLAGLDVISDVLGASSPSFSPAVGNRSLQAARERALPCCRWDAQMASPSATIFLGHPFLMCYAVQGESEGKRGREGEREMAEKSLCQRCKERVLMGLMASLTSGWRACDKTTQMSSCICAPEGACHDTGRPV